MQIVESEGWWRLHRGSRVFFRKTQRGDMFFSKRMQQQFNNRMLERLLIKKKKEKRRSRAHEAGTHCKKAGTTLWGAGKELPLPWPSVLARHSSVDLALRAGLPGPATYWKNVLQGVKTCENNQYNNANIYYFIQVTQQSQPKRWRNSNKFWNLDV